MRIDLTKDVLKGFVGSCLVKDFDGQYKTPGCHEEWWELCCSKEKYVAKSPLAESPRFPAQRSSAQGESAPKARQRCVADGKQVNIPVPINSAMWGRRG